MAMMAVVTDALGAAAVAVATTIRVSQTATVAAGLDAVRSLLNRAVSPVRLVIPPSPPKDIAVAFLTSQGRPQWR